MHRGRNSEPCLHQSRSLVQQNFILSVRSRALLQQTGDRCVPVPTVAAHFTECGVRDVVSVLCHSSGFNSFNFRAEMQFYLPLGYRKAGTLQHTAVPRSFNFSAQSCCSFSQSSLGVPLTSENLWAHCNSGMHDAPTLPFPAFRAFPGLVPSVPRTPYR